ncbi:YrrS family protein [Rummeliibacillus sp. NPDC094406]|uniref:YrrS family protein n=1 Tax=Rummeliibacillus sp. NPDC094406 TaxID=3364511 RepID=UPI003805FB93
MAEIRRRYNPGEKKPKNTGKRKMDKILNVLIGIVVVLILIVAGVIVIGGSKDKESANNNKVEKNVKQDTDEKDENIVEKDSKELEKEKAKQAEKAKEESTNQQDENQGVTSTETNQDSTNSNSTEQNNTEVATGSNSNTSSSDTSTNSNYNYEVSKTATTESSNDQNVQKVITDSNWKPTKTAQKDDGSTHTSSYDKGSVDWKEKIKTIATTTGLDENDMIVWYVKNGGSPDTSIGIVSSKDKKKSYRVSLKWVTNEGWQPTKLEVLKSYKGAY